MSTETKTTSTFIAAAAAGLLLSGCASMGMGGGDKMAKADGVHCYGINSCKGNTACKSASNECKGKNSCKGKGWIKASSASECTDKGGTV